MRILFFALAFLCPIFFFLMGLEQKGRLRRLLLKESLLVFFAALFFAPAVTLFGTEESAGILTAGIFFLQFFLLAKGEVVFLKKDKNRNKS